MNRIVVAVVLHFIFLSHAYSQIRFEPGHLVDSTGNRIECLIKNQDWRTTPDKFIYKLSESDSMRTGTPANVSEFNVHGFPRYVKADVKIDQSPSELTMLTSNKNPVWLQQKVFLKLLVDGKAKLYSWSGGNLQRFFYAIEGNAIQQLVFKEYVVTQGRIGKNKTYHSQLWNELRCGNTEVAKLQLVRYLEKDLVKYFQTYNACNNSLPEESQSVRASRNVFNLRLVAGVNLNSFDIVQNLGLVKFEFPFENSVTPRVGVEVEFILPFHKNKWGIAFEPSYQSYRSKITTNHATSVTNNCSVNYSFIEVAIGVRHYFFLSDKTALFLNVFYTPQFRHVMKDELILDNEKYELNQVDGFSAGFGVLRGRFSAEVRRYGKGDLMSHYLSFRSEFGRTSLSFGYRIVHLKK